ncbi:anaerobic ribonucleoside-triphosphate reductase [Jeotgalibaca arthritidis]|uniref:anaerobic ribonucleoside-triphosphate reductase n=1 Tax=Jeotgalibaca arthritidis TaxID=1868794 RepID=UPI0035A03D20
MCRAYLGKYYHPETGEMVVTGRNNIGAVSLNLPKIAIESKDDQKLFYQLIDKYSQMVWDIHDFSFEKIAKSKGSSSPLLFCEGGSWMSVGYDEEIRPIIKASTASLGFVGLNEASEFMFDKSIAKNEDFGLEVAKYLKDKWVDGENGKHEFITAFYATPAENLVYRFQMMNREQYGSIDKVTDRDYATNSFHVAVSEEISAVEKIYKEADYHQIVTGGRITFAEYPYGITVETLKQCVDYAMELGLYNGVNIVSSSCSNCLHQGDFLDECPKCQNKDITTVTRACGYLSFSKIKGDTRYNLGKQAEIRERVKHS